MVKLAWEYTKGVMRHPKLIFLGVCCWEMRGASPSLCTSSIEGVLSPHSSTLHSSPLEPFLNKGLVQVSSLSMPKELQDVLVAVVMKRIAVAWLSCKFLSFLVSKCTPKGLQWTAMRSSHCIRFFHFELQFNDVISHLILELYSFLALWWLCW